MARIREYTQQTTVSGEVGGRRATAEDFGSGAAMQNFGEAVTNVAGYIKQENERREVEDASVKMAQARQKWTETYLARQQSAEPGDMSMAPALRDEMNSYFTSMAEGYSSPQAKKYVQMHGVGMATDFFARGLQYQQHQAGVKARADFDVKVKAYSDTTSADPAQYDAVKRNILFDIDSDPRLRNEADKSKLAQKATGDVAWATAMKVAETPALRASVAHLLPRNEISDEQLGAKYAEMEKAGATPAELAAFIKVNRPTAAVDISGAKYSDEALKGQETPSWFKDLTPERRVSFLRTMESYQSQEDRVAAQALRQQVENHSSYRAMTGQNPSQPLPRVAFKDNQAAWEVYQAEQIATDKLVGVWNIPFDQGQKVVESLKPMEAEIANPAFASKVQVYAQAQKIFEARSQQIAKDNIAADMSSNFAPGTGRMTAISTAAPDKWAAELIVRVPQATASSNMRNLPLRVLAESEAKGMRQVFDQMDTKKQMETIGSLRGAVAPEVFRTVINQMANGDKALLVAGIVASSQYGGDTRDADAENIIIGRNAMTRVLKGGGNEQERGFKAVGLPNAGDAYRLASQKIQGLLGVSEAEKEAMVEGAMAHYVGASLRKNSFANMDLSGTGTENNRVAFGKSLESIIPVSKMGAYTVLRPYGMSEGVFKDAMDANVSVLFGGKYKKGDYSVMMQGGKYQIVAGGVPQGEPFSLRPFGKYSNEGRAYATQQESEAQ